MSVLINTELDLRNSAYTEQFLGPIDYRHVKNNLTIFFVQKKIF